MKFRDPIRILEAHGFVLDRQRGSHRTYKGVVAGEKRVVTIACHRESDDIKPDNCLRSSDSRGCPSAYFAAEGLKPPMAW